MMAEKMASQILKGSLKAVSWVCLKWMATHLVEKTVDWILTVIRLAAKLAMKISTDSQMAASLA